MDEEKILLNENEDVLVSGTVEYHCDTVAIGTDTVLIGDNKICIDYTKEV